jgi:hypothetical protein
MDLAQAISKAQDVVTKASLPANLQQAAFSEILRHLLDTADTADTAGAAAGTSPSTGAGSSAPPASPGDPGWSQVTNTGTSSTAP